MKLTAKDLIEQLQKLPPESLVMITVEDKYTNDVVLRPGFYDSRLQWIYSQDERETAQEDLRYFCGKNKELETTPAVSIELA